MAGVLAGHGAELSRTRTTYGGDKLDGRARLGDGGEIEDGGGGGEDRRVDRKVEDE